MAPLVTNIADELRTIEGVVGDAHSAVLPSFAVAALHVTLCHDMR